MVLVVVVVVVGRFLLPFKCCWRAAIALDWFVAASASVLLEYHRASSSSVMYRRYDFFDLVLGIRYFTDHSSPFSFDVACRYATFPSSWLPTFIQLEDMYNANVVVSRCPSGCFGPKEGVSLLERTMPKKFSSQKIEIALDLMCKHMAINF